MIATKWQSVLNWDQTQLEEIRLLAYTYIKEGRLADAITLFKALTTLSPDGVYDLQTLGALYLQTGESEEALSVLERALSLDPEDEPSLLNQAKALLVLGQLEEGLNVAKTLTSAKIPQIAQSAEALLLAYGSQEAL